MTLLYVGPPEHFGNGFLFRVGVWFEIKNGFNPSRYDQFRTLKTRPGGAVKVRTGQGNTASGGIPDRVGFCMGANSLLQALTGRGAIGALTAGARFTRATARSPIESLSDKTLFWRHQHASDLSALTFGLAGETVGHVPP
jgi:hypothetical protein